MSSCSTSVDLLGRPDYHDQGGVELDRFSVSLNYCHCFADIRPDGPGSKERYKNRVMPVFMASRFKQKSFRCTVE